MDRIPNSEAWAKQLYDIGWLVEISLRLFSDTLIMHNNNHIYACWEITGVKDAVSSSNMNVTIIITNSDWSCWPVRFSSQVSAQFCYLPLITLSYVVSFKLSLVIAHIFCSNEKFVRKNDLAELVMKAAWTHDLTY